VWALNSYTDIPDGARAVQPFGSSPAGILIYTSDGFVSAQLMAPGRVSSDSVKWDNWSPEEYETFGHGYIGYCGRYEVDEENATVTHLPSVAFLPNLVGHRHLRHVAISGDRLTLRASYRRADRINATSCLEWSRIGGGSQQAPLTRPQLEDQGIS
jgi:hypothetical protein